MTTIEQERTIDQEVKRLLVRTMINCRMVKHQPDNLFTLASDRKALGTSIASRLS